MMNKIRIVVFLVYLAQCSVLGNEYKLSLGSSDEQSLVYDENQKIPLSHSVLATGNWFQFYVEKTGVHKITYQFLSELGMDVSHMDPRTIKIYGNGGSMLPLQNKKNSRFDLRENAIKLVGTDDGTFSEEDYILFYGEGTQQYNPDSKTHINIYDDKSFYFITASGKKGNRILKEKNIQKKRDTLITSFVDHQFHEIDEFNLGLLGRRWFGDKMEKDVEKHVEFHFPNRVEASSVTYTVLAASQSNKTSQLQIVFNKNPIEKIKFRPASRGVIAREGRLSRTFKSNADSIHMHMKYVVDQKAAGKGYIDYIRISAPRRLVGTDTQLEFSTDVYDNTDKIALLQLKNMQNIAEVWDVTDPSAIRTYENIAFRKEFDFKIRLDRARKFITVPVYSFYEPLKTYNSRVENQDLKGTIFLDDDNTFRDIDYLIITKKEMVQAAEKLANFHREKHHLNVKVVPLYKIYNEFSSGKQDIAAIRNFIRYVYLNASHKSKRISYVCLMGNATIDYKNTLLQNSKLNTYKTNDVPSFLSYESFSKIRSYVSDDFFVMMDPEEGTMQLKDKLDITIGRILVEDPKNAEEVVDKVLRYSKKSSYGDWRNNVLLLSDDVDKGWEQNIQKNLDKLADTLTTNFPFFNISKIYSDSYQQKSSFSGERYPTVTAELMDRINMGVAVLDYFGHAEEEGFGTEFFFTKKEAIHLKNKDRLPLFITVTCLATRFDNVFKTSIGEYIFRNPNGGAIAIIATTREISLHSGIRINNKVIEYLFSDNGPFLKPAETVLRLKNELMFRDKRNVFFIGDPALSLQMPQSGARITHINDIPVRKFNDTLRALDKVKISGVIADTDGNVDKNYDGEIQLTVFDKEISKSTLGNNYIKDAAKKIIKMNYKSQNTIISRSRATVKKGKFNLSFVLPKDMDISIGTRKMSLYSKDAAANQDVFGVRNDIVMGGVSKSYPNDTKGPEMQLFLDNKKAKDISVIRPDTELKIKVWDQNGINVSEGIGHQIKLVIDEEERMPICLNDMYRNKENDYKEGVITYSLKDLETGYHSLKVKIWDTFNNSTTQTIKIIKVESL